VRFIILSHICSEVPTAQFEIMSQSPAEQPPVPWVDPGTAWFPVSGEWISETWAGLELRGTQLPIPLPMETLHRSREVMEQRAFDDPVMDSGTQAPEGRSDAISMIVREGQPAEAPPMSAEETWLPRPRSGDPRDLRQACRECYSAYIRTQVTQESTDALLGSTCPERDTYSRNQAPVVNAMVMDDAVIPRDVVYIPTF
jgi:hypothetical protein